MTLRAHFLIALDYGRRPEYVEMLPLFPDAWLTNLASRLGWWCGRFILFMQQAGGES